jgi:hypothetical protein
MKIKKVGAIIGICAAIIGALLYSVNAYFREIFEEVTDVRRYESIVAKSGLGSSGEKFLPDNIPAGASDVFFYHSPGALQAPYIVALRIRVSGYGVEKMEKVLIQSGRKIYEIQPHGYVTSEYDPKKPGGIRIYCTSLPEGFSVYMYDADYQDFKRRNDGSIKYVAISRQTGEVVFCYDGG